MTDVAVIHLEPRNVQEIARARGPSSLSSPKCRTCDGWGIVVPPGAVWWGLCPDCARPNAYAAVGLPDPYGPRSMSAREAQIAALLASEGQVMLPHDYDAAKLGLRIIVPTCRCPDGPQPFSFDRCFTCAQTKLSFVERPITKADELSMIGLSPRALSGMAQGLKRDHQITVPAMSYGRRQANGKAIVTFAAIAADYNPDAGRIEATPEFVRYFVDANEGVGAL